MSAPDERAQRRKRLAASRHAVVRRERRQGYARRAR
jgi:hypothetical protein